MSPLDPFSKTDRLDAGTLDTLVARFEARAQHPRFRGMLDEYLDALDLERARSVLDMGCGTGLAARTVARRPEFTGTVAGLDLSPHFIEAAKALAREEGVADRVEFRAGHAADLPFDDASFDAVIAHTLLSHVDDPSAALDEATRVLAPGGTLAVFDGDFASLSFGHDDPDKEEALDRALIMAIVANPRIMRRLPRMFRARGLEIVTSFSHVLAEIGTADFWISGIEAYRKLIPKAGVMSEGEADAWAARLRRDSDDGVFFGTCNFIAYVAKRPR